LEFRHSSYWQLGQPKTRPKFFHAQTALAEAGGLADTPVGHRCYAEYLAWQANDGPLGRNKSYVSLSQGWALGTTGFKQALIKDHALAEETRAWAPGGVKEIREAQWAEAIGRALQVAGKTLADVKAAPKSARWKLAVAAWMKQRTQVGNRWLSEQLDLGAPAALSRNLTGFRRNIAANDKLWRRLIAISAA
jgi:hypothetical protein